MSEKELHKERCNFIIRFLFHLTLTLRHITKYNQLANEL